MRPSPKAIAQRISDWFLALYVWTDVALFMTAERIEQRWPTMERFTP